MDNEPKFRKQLDVYEDEVALMALEIKAIAPSLQKYVLNEERITYPQVKFEKYFAPFFLGIYEAPPNYNMEDMWDAETNGGRSSDVDIVNDQGKVLFTVPAIRSLSVLSIKENGTNPIRFNSLENVQKGEALNTPVKARVDYINGVSAKLGTLFNEYQGNDLQVEKWIRIFEFYNVKPPVPENMRIIDLDSVTAKNSGSSSSTNWGGLEDVGFEPPEGF